MKNLEIIKRCSVQAALWLIFMMSGVEYSWSKSATTRDECATLTITSSDIYPNGEYFIDAEGTILNGYYYMAYIYMDNVLIDSDYSFWGNSFSASNGPFTGEHLFRLDMRGGTSHGICSSSVELTAGGTEKGPAEMAGEICAAISDLPGSAFKNNPDRRKKALCNKLDEVAAIADYAVNSADPVVQGQLYIDAIEKVQNDIGTKMDGNHGGSPKNDWITDDDAQSVIYPMAKELMEILQGML